MFTGLTPSPLLPWSLLLAGLMAAAPADWLARRRLEGESGTYWSWIMLWVCLLLAPALVLLRWLEMLWPGYWHTGWHLYPDLTGAFGWSAQQCYPAALLLPFAVWLLLLPAGLLRRPVDPPTGHWLAGGIGFRNTRRWVLLCAAPLVAILMVTAADLGGGETAYPAAAWGTLAVVVLSLLGVAYSAGRPPSLPNGKTAETGTDGRLSPWPEALAACGIRLRSLADWPAIAPARPPRGTVPQALAERLRWRGAQAVAPELIEAVAQLLEPSPDTTGYGPLHLLFAPDNCGQVETVSLAAEWLEQRLHVLTLIITAADEVGLAVRFQRWLPGQERRVIPLLGAGDIPAEALLVVVSAEFLSDRLLPLLKHPLMAKRIGMVVWWHLQNYTGVQGANLWAISRRLYRLLRSRGRRDVRTLALIRSAPHGSAQLAEFVRRLLPQPPSGAVEFHLETRLPRPLNLHAVESVEDYLAQADNRQLPHRLRQPLLLAAKASVETGWSTCLVAPGNVARSELDSFHQLPVRLPVAASQATLGEALCADGSVAGAYLLHLSDSEVLSLLEIISQSGRATLPDLPRHVAITRPDNPYAAWLLSTLAGTGGFTASRRLICAEAHPGIIRRHLLLALNELPDTRSGLLQNALWEEQVVQETLDNIAFQGLLIQREVRFLDANDRLVRELEYKSLIIPGVESRPLDTVGINLIDVRDPTDGSVQRRVDPERLLIKAYPRRVFMQAGQRYRIRDWYSVDEVRERGWLECRREDQHSLTWRMRNAFVFGMKPLPAETAVAIGQRARLLTRFTVDLSYEEEVVGVLNLTPAPAGVTTTPRPEISLLEQPLTQSFATRALVLRLPAPPKPLALASLCQGLRHVLPVHLGVEEDALEVIALQGEDIDDQATFGMALVDLYPGGIGLIDAIRDDNAWILQLLEATREWLSACSDEVLCSPSAQAANPYQSPQRSAALELLNQIL